jgi:hypothetical protein
MEWTVRYFLNMKEKWVSRLGPSLTGRINSGSGSGSGVADNTGILSPGATAYCHRKIGVWEELMKKADSIFRFSNPAYQSPL